MRLAFVLKPIKIFTVITCFLLNAIQAQATPINNNQSSKFKSPLSSTKSMPSSSSDKIEPPIKIILSVLENLSDAGLNSPEIEFAYVVPRKHKNSLASDLIAQNGKEPIDKKIVKSKGKDKVDLSLKQLTAECSRTSEPAVDNRTFITVNCKVLKMRKSRKSITHNPIESIDSIFKQLKNSHLYTYRIMFGLPTHKSSASLLQIFKTYQKQQGFSSNQLSAKSSKITSAINIRFDKDSELVSCYKISSSANRQSNINQRVECRTKQSLYIKKARLW